MTGLQIKNRSVVVGGGGRWEWRGWGGDCGYRRVSERNPVLEMFPTLAVRVDTGT